MNLEMFFIDVRTELRKARRAFPTNKHLGMAFAEESGELIKAVLDFEQKDGSERQIYKEAVQACAMAIRLVEEGSEELEYRGVSFGDDFSI
jgi:hypothetical protein